MNRFVILPGNHARQFLKPLLEKRANWMETESIDAKCNFIWKPEQLTAKVRSNKENLLMEAACSRSPGNVVHNHLDNHKEITTKTGLIKSLRNFYSSYDQALLFSYQIHDSIPTSFIISTPYEDFEFQALVSRIGELANLHSNKERTPLKHCLKNIWLVKPANLNQGKGIELCRNMKEILKCLRAKPQNSVWLVQKYIEKPLLFAGRKFDIRVWAVATSKRELFYYRKGYIRTSSFEYSTEHKDQYVHLTNNCLQQLGDMYGVYEKGNTLSFDDFQSYLTETFPEFSINLEQHIVPRFKDLIIDSYLSCKKTIHKNKKSSAFELFGYDFLIDEDFRVWLLEVNTNPYLGVPNEYINDLLPTMLDDLLEISVDPYIPPIKKKEGKNDFELLYCEAGSCFNDGKAINQRQSFGASFYPVAELSQQPLCKQCIAHRYEEDPMKIAQKDLIQLVKSFIESDASAESSDFLEVAKKIFAQLSISRDAPREQNNLAIEALKILLNNSKVNAFAEGKIAKKLVGLLGNDLVKESVKEKILQILMQSGKSIINRKHLTENGLVAAYISEILKSPNEQSQNLCIQGLLNLCYNPDKGIYVPGRSQEIKLIKGKIISQGGILCLLCLSIGLNDTLTDKIKDFFEKELTIEDCKSQLQVLHENLNGFGEFPSVLLEQDLEKVEQLLSAIINAKTQRIIEKQNNIRKLREEQEKHVKAVKAKQQEIEEEKKTKVEEYIRRKTLELKRNKTEMIKMTKIEKEEEEKLMQEKRLAILLKKRIENKASTLKKALSEEKGMKKLELARKKINDKNRKRLMKEWLNFKAQLDKSIAKKTIKEKLKSAADKALLGMQRKVEGQGQRKSDGNSGQRKELLRHNSQKSFPSSIFARLENDKMKSFAATLNKEFSTKSYSELKAKLMLL